MTHTIIHWVTAHGYGIIFTVFALGIFGIPLPNDLLLAYLGYLIFKGKLLPVPTVIAVFFGSICGMTFNYVLGRTFGLYVVHKFGVLVRLTEEKINRVHNWFEHSGRWGLVFGYFLPGIRHLTAFAAGTSKMTFIEFVIFSSAGGLIWACTFISLGYFLEERWSEETARISHILEVASVAVLAVLSLYMLMRWVQKKRAR